MIDPTPGTAPRGEPLTDAEREARIEQLLVSGLDEYFAGRMDHAVNIWTRVLFLDRTNDRAKAYIDRARRSQAERQRESDALVHQGIDAFEAGDVDRARALLTSAVDRGAPHEQVLPVLHRIGLLEVGPAPAGPSSASGRWKRGPARPDVAGRGRMVPWTIALAVAIASAAALILADRAVEPTAAPAALEGPRGSLPVPSAAEAHLRRARQLFDAGKLPDALTALERVAVGSPTYAEAQAMRARVQRELLRAAEPGSAESRQP